MGVTGNQMRDLGPLKDHGVLDAAATWGVATGGWGIDTSGDGVAVTPAIGSETDAFTMFMHGNITGSASNQYLYDQQATRMLPMWINGIFSGGSTSVTCWINSSQVNSGVWTTLIAGPLTMVSIVTQTPDTRKMWVNSSDSSSGMSGPVLRIDDATAFTDWGASSGGCRIGERYTSDTNKFQGLIHLLGIDHYAWPAAEVLGFMADPYAMLRPRRRVFAVPAAAPAGARSRMLGGGLMVGGAV